MRSLKRLAFAVIARRVNRHAIEVKRQKVAAHSDSRHVNKREVDAFPVDLNRLEVSPEALSAMKLSKAVMHDLETRASWMKSTRCWGVITASRTRNWTSSSIKTLTTGWDRLPRTMKTEGTYAGRA